MRIPKGHPGSWFAEWEGESIPCIHQHAITSGRYIDMGVDDHPAWPRFIEQLSAQRRAILTTSHLPGGDGIRRRKSYVGIWEIGEVSVEDGTMSFEMGSPILRFR